jgi:RNA polymerase-binding transcription factor DksA
MSDAALSTARASLEEERANLRRQLAELTGMELDHNFADASSVAAEQGEVRVLADNLTALLGEVDLALGKLERGEYGRCETCGEPIAPPRLEAMPASRWCVEHAGT